jgi:uncharacterized protein (DUF2249 family)
MATQLDLRDCPADDRATRLFDALTDAETGDSLDVVADSDVDPELVRYQLDRGRTLDWEYDHPDEEPRELSVTVGESLEDAALATIDVRDLRPQRRHEVLLDIFDDLEAEEGFVLVNDHDPKPLYHELRSMHGDVVEWSYASRGADGWRVEVVKTGASESADDDVVTRYDVREIPKAERHPTLHHRYGMLPDGGTMELIAPHEPRPLHREFREQYGDDFEWSVVESEPGRCQVQITKAPADDAAAADAQPDEDASSQPSEDSLSVVEELDVRDRPPAERHERIFDAYDELAAGEGFVLVNDHDPKPLYHQFEAEAGPAFRWSYRQREPGEFRVLVGKADVASDDEQEEPEPPF